MFEFLLRLLCDWVLSVRVAFVSWFYTFSFDKEMVELLVEKSRKARLSKEVPTLSMREEELERCFRAMRFQTIFEMVEVVEALCHLVDSHRGSEFFLMVGLLKMKGEFSQFAKRSLLSNRRMDKEYIAGWQSFVALGDMEATLREIEAEELEKKLADVQEKLEDMRAVKNELEVDNYKMRIGYQPKSSSIADSKTIPETEATNKKTVVINPEGMKDLEDSLVFAFEFVPEWLKRHILLLQSPEATKDMPAESMEKLLSPDWFALHELTDDDSNVGSRYNKIRCNPWHYIYYDKGLKTAYLVQESSKRYKKLSDKPY